VNCEYSVLFNSPEAILEEKWLIVFKSDYRDKIGVVTIDEVQCVTEWYDVSGMFYFS
jgi:superfamily II DNA helicase RecQ